MFEPSQLVPALITAAIFLLVGFPVHEFAHAAVAYLQGDATAKLFGRLTLNPIVHFDPLGGLMTIVSLLVGGFLIGWAKPTPVNPANLRDRRNGEVIVALAGPASNLLMAIVAAFVFRVLEAAGVEMRGNSPIGTIVYLFVVYNVLLAIFNFLPIPPLDGSTLLYRMLSPRQVWQVRPFLTQYGIFLVLGFVIIFSRVLGDVIRGVANALVGA